MKRRIKLTENDLHRMVKESVKRILKENDNDYRYMSDDEINSQYDDFVITYLTVRRSNNGNGFVGTIELEFPNSNDIDFDSIVYDNFYIYDNKATRFGFDRWYPSHITEMLKDEIRKYIKNNNI